MRSRVLPESPRLPREIRNELADALTELESVASSGGIRFDPAQARIFRAPGRLNLIGDHTDYNGGLVLPMAIDLAVYLACVPSERVFLTSSAEQGLVALEPDGSSPIDERSLPEWGRYPQGVLAELARRGRPQVGFAGAIVSRIPPGRGLSSSAALEVAVATAALALADFSLSPWDLAEACRCAEERYAGVECGIMDQAISVMGKAGCTFLIDTKHRTGEYIPLPYEIDIVAIDSGVRRNLASGEYNTRRAECASALGTLAQNSRFSEIETLSDLTLEDLDEAIELLPDRLAKRVRHVVTENARVRKVAEILRALYERLSEGSEPKGSEMPGSIHASLEPGDVRALRPEHRTSSSLTAPRLVAELGALLEQSHNSLVSDYEAGHPITDLVVEEAARQEGYIGARQTGAGWGGSVVVFAKKGKGAEVATSVIEKLERLAEHEDADALRYRASLSPTFHLCRSSEGASEL